jgi:hypothetical protein
MKRFSFVPLLFLFFLVIQTSQAYAQRYSCGGFYGPSPECGGPYPPYGGGGYYYYYAPPPPDPAPFFANGYETVAPADSFGTFVYVQDLNTGANIPNATVNFDIFPLLFTGGHSHDSPLGWPLDHPTGKLNADSCVTDQYGSCFIIYQASYAGQEEQIEGCEASSGNCDFAYVHVAYDDLFFFTAGSFGGNDTGATVAHPVNHWATLDAIGGIALAFGDYYQTYGFGTVLGANDATIENGGWFDLGLNFICPHQYHGRGTAVDVNSFPDSAHRDQFLAMCRNEGANFTAGEPGPTNAHCEWPDNIVRFPTASCALFAPGQPPPLR